MSERTGERYTRDEIQYAVFEHLWIPGAEVAVYDAKAVPPEFREEQRRRARRIVVEIERAMEALPLRDWKRVLARAERSAGRGPWNRGRRPESGRR